MTRCSILVSALVVVLLGGSTVWAQSFALRQADLSIRNVTLQAMDNAQITFAYVATDTGNRSGEVASLPLDLVMGLTATGEWITPSMQPVVIMADGQRLAGQLVALAGDQLKLTTQSMGEVTVPISACSEIIAQPSEPLSYTSPQTPDKDRLLLLNGDLVEGAISSFHTGMWKVSTSAGEVEVPASAVAKISLAQLGLTGAGVASATGAPGVWRVDLADGSSLRVSRVALAGGQWSLLMAPSKLAVTSGALVKVPLPQVKRLENFAAKTVSALACSVPKTSFSAMLPSPIEADVSGVQVLGGWIPADVSVGLAKYSRCLRVRPRSGITFTVPQGYTQMRFGASLAGDSLRQPLAAAEIVVLQGGHELFHHTLSSTGLPDKALSVTFAAGDTPVELTMSILEGANLGISDEVLIIEPVFTRP